MPACSQTIDVSQRAPGTREIVRVDPLQQIRVGFVQALVEGADHIVDAIVETAKRGIVRWRRGILDDGRDQLASRLRLGTFPEIRNQIFLRSIKGPGCNRVGRRDANHQRISRKIEDDTPPPMHLQIAESDFLLPCVMSV